MVLVHGLLVILSSRRFSSVEVSWWVGPCTMGESRLTSWVETSRQVSRRHGDRHGESKDTSTKISNNTSLFPPSLFPITSGHHPSIADPASAFGFYEH